MLFASHYELAHDLLTEGEATGERFQGLPLDHGHDDGLRSPIAGPRQHTLDPEDGNCAVAAAFLRNFTERHPLVHLDIAGKEIVAEDRLHARAG